MALSPERAAQIPVISLMGTTATGKTDAAAAMVDAFDAEIISVDSSLVYRGMNIGTAKPDADFLARYPHHLVDIRNPEETYSAADFYQDAYSLIQRITAAGRVPVLAGGTHFYFNAIHQGISELPQADPQLRAQISADAQTQGWQKMHARLAAVDPESAARIDPADAQRIQRAMEVVLQSGRAVSAHNQSRKPAPGNPQINIALAFSDRAFLHQRIEQRFDRMLELGLEAEVVSLLDSGIDPATPALKMIGYRQMLEFLRGDTTYEEMRLKGIAATRQLAKRQLTWLRNRPNTLWWVDFGLKQKNFTLLIDYVDQMLR